MKRGILYLDIAAATTFKEEKKKQIAQFAANGITIVVIPGKKASNFFIIDDISNDEKIDVILYAPTPKLNSSELNDVVNDLQAMNVNIISKVPDDSAQIIQIDVIADVSPFSMLNETIEEK